MPNPINMLVLTVHPFYFEYFTAFIYHAKAYMYNNKLKKKVV